MTDTVADELLQKFESFDTSIVSDALDQHGLDGVVTGLKPAHPDHVAVGRAMPVTFELIAGEESTNFPYAMLEALDDGELIVIDGVTENISCWGGRASQLAANAGVRGVVVNGGYRDVTDIRRGSFPVFAATSTPRTGQRRVRVTSTSDPVSVDGVSVAEGDVVVADSTGVVIVPATIAKAVASTAGDILDEERVLESKIENGATVDDLAQDRHQF